MTSRLTDPTDALAQELLSPPAGDRELDDGLLRLLGEPLRARMVELLSREVLCTSHLVELTGAKQTNVSNHLRLLRSTGLTTDEPCGRYSYHRLDPAPLRRLAAQLTALADAADADLPRRACA